MKNCPKRNQKALGSLIRGISNDFFCVGLKMFLELFLFRDLDRFDNLKTFKLLNSGENISK